MSTFEYKLLVFWLQEKHISAFCQKNKNTTPSNTTAESRIVLIKTSIKQQVADNNIKNHFSCNLQICKVSGYLKLRSILLTNMKHY